jgi:glycosyltransferase involved in cell wall biosynthesis
MTTEFTSNQVRSDMISPIPQAVDIDRFQPVTEEQKAQLRQRLGLSQDKKILVFTGRLVSYKGLPLLLKVWEQVHEKHQDTFLLLVGSGGSDIYNCEEGLKEFVRSHYLQDSVGFTGEVSNVHEYLQASDIFVFPTENEAFGISLIEAMACGLPVIATSVGGIKDIITPGQDGLIIAPKDFRQLHGAVRLLLTDTALAKSLGEAARQTATERYSQQTIVTRYLEVFRTVGVSA